MKEKTLLLVYISSGLKLTPNNNKLMSRSSWLSRSRLIAFRCCVTRSIQPVRISCPRRTPSLTSTQNSVCPSVASVLHGKQFVRCWWIKHWEAHLVSVSRSKSCVQCCTMKHYNDTSAVLRFVKDAPSRGQPWSPPRSSSMPRGATSKCATPDWLLPTWSKRLITIWSVRRITSDVREESPRAYN